MDFTDRHNNTFITLSSDGRTHIDQAIVAGLTGDYAYFTYAHISDTNVIDTIAESITITGGFITLTGNIDLGNDLIKISTPIGEEAFTVNESGKATAKKGLEITGQSLTTNTISLVNLNTIDISN